MKKYTQAEFDMLPVNEDRIKQCPTGDYTEIKTFGKGCSFGKCCSFGEGCSYCDFTFTNIKCLYGVHKHSIIIYWNKNEYMLNIGCENFKTLDNAVEEANKRNIYCETTHKVLKLLLGV